MIILIIIIELSVGYSPRVGHFQNNGPNQLCPPPHPPPHILGTAPKVGFTYLLRHKAKVTNMNLNIP